MKPLSVLLSREAVDEDGVYFAREINPAVYGGGSHGAHSSGDGAVASIFRPDGGGVSHKYKASGFLFHQSGPHTVSGIDPASSDDGNGPEADDGNEGGGVPDGNPDGTSDPDLPPDDNDAPIVDTIQYASAGDDILSGGEGADTFVFGLNTGSDVITNFNVDNDILDLSAYGFTSIDDVVARAEPDAAGLALVLDGGRIVLNDVTFQQAADLHVLFA